MATNAENERLKREYFSYLKEARGFSEASIDGVAKALGRFEMYTRHRDFRSFKINQATGFKKQLSKASNQRTGEMLSKATLYSTLNSLKNFFQWLAGRQGFKSRIAYTDADYFNLSEKETRIAKARRERAGPTLAQIRHVVAQMPARSDIEKRNRALIALMILTGARDGAVASLRLKHVDLVEGRIVQDAREVRTKFSKTFTTYFFPVGAEFQRIVEEWVNYLRNVKLWGPDDPVFPATEVGLDGKRGFSAIGLRRENWKDAGPIRKIFKEAFVAAGLPYAYPHSFRNTLALLGESACATVEEFKAWSQNLGHSKVLVTLMSYGNLPEHRQGQVIKRLSLPVGESRIAG